MTAKNNSNEGFGVNPITAESAGGKTPIARAGEEVTVEGEFQDINELYDAIDQKIQSLGFERVVDDPESGINIMNTTDRKIEKFIGYVKKGQDEYYEIEVYTYFEKQIGKLWASIIIAPIGSSEDLEISKDSTLMWMEHLVHTLFNETEFGFQSDEQGFYTVTSEGKVYCPFCEVMSEEI